MTDLLTQVKAALAQIPPFKKVVVGVSGGRDSVVLAHVLKHLGYEVVIAHLNHGLRGEASDKDEKFVVDLAQAWGLPFMTSKAVIPKKGNLEHNARNIRYSFLEDVRQATASEFIAVGHHFDDQIETILLHEKRGAGLRGRRGMKLIKNHLIRPLLNISQREVEAYATAHLLDFVVDETNMDMSFARNHLRHEVIPKLKEDPDFEKMIRKMSLEADEKLNELQLLKEGWMQSFLKDNSFDRSAFNELDLDLRAEILLEILGQQDIYCTTIQRLTTFIEKGQSGKELQVKAMLFILEYDRVRLMAKELKEDDLSSAHFDEKINWGDYEITVKGIEVLKVRSWQPGDRFQPSGMQGTKKLQDFFVDEKIPQRERKKIPILVDDHDNIICVGDLRFSEKFKALKDQIKIELKK